MAIKYVKKWSSFSRDVYLISIPDHQILTTVTSNPEEVQQWVSRIVSDRCYPQDKLVVGLDMEWRPNIEPGSDNPVATLQLCVGHRCLIVQMMHAVVFPLGLVEFLANHSGSYTFVGVGIAEDARKLQKDYYLEVNNVVDLRDLAATRFCRPHLKRFGLKKLAIEVVNMELEKPIEVTLSPWDCRYLSLRQIEYACLDAFASFEIGRSLQAFNFEINMPAN